MNPENQIGTKLKRLHLLIKQDFNHSLSVLGLTSSQSQVLYCILKQYPAPTYPKDVESRLHLTHPTVLGILQRLEAKQYIRIEPDRNDRRCRSIIPTDKAFEIQREMIERIETIEKTMSNGMSPEQVEALLSLLDKAAENLMKLESEEDLTK